jgi:hypothetical protein
MSENELQGVPAVPGIGTINVALSGLRMNASDLAEALTKVTVPTEDRNTHEQLVNLFSEIDDALGDWDFTLQAIALFLGLAIQYGEEQEHHQIAEVADMLKTLVDAAVLDRGN